MIGGTGRKVSPSELPMREPKVKPQRVPRTAAPRPTAAGGAHDGPSVADALNLADWADILEPHGWEYVGSDSGEKWLRPGGAESEYSARAFEFCLYVHSTSAGLPDNEGLTKFRTWSWLNGCEEDLSAAAKALIAGDHDLPDHVADAIKAAADGWLASQAPKILVKPSLKAWAAQDDREALKQLAAEEAPPAQDQQDAGPVPVDEDTYTAFRDTFTETTKPRMADNRARWLAGDLITRPAIRISTWTRHALKAFREVIAGSYAASTAEAFLAEHAPHEIGDVQHALRAVLAAALSQEEVPTP